MGRGPFASILVKEEGNVKNPEAMRDVPGQGNGPRNSAVQQPDQSQVVKQRKPAQKQGKKVNRRLPGPGIPGPDAGRVFLLQLFRIL